MDSPGYASLRTMNDAPTPSPDTTPRRTLRLRVAVAAGAVLLTLAAAEIAARVAAGPRFAQGARQLRPQDALGRFDPDLGWALRPNVTTSLLADGTSYRVSTNARGFRGAEIPEARTPGRPRIVVLGDSFAFGWGVNDGETFAERLAETAHVEIANLGVPGHSTDQALWLLDHEAARLRPDVVLLQFCVNDFDGNETASAHPYAKPCWVRDPAGAWEERGRPVVMKAPIGAVPATWSETFAAHSALWSVVTGSVPIRATESVGDDTSAVRAAQESVAHMGPDSVTAMLLARLKVRCDAIGARLAVFDASTPGRLDRPPGGADRSMLLSPVSRRLAEIGRDAGFTVLSVDRALIDAADRGESVTIPDGHWNAAGHAVVAAALAEQLAPMLPR